MFGIPINLIFSHDIIIQSNVTYSILPVSGIPRFDITKAALGHRYTTVKCMDLSCRICKCCNSILEHLLKFIRIYGDYLLELEVDYSNEK